MAAAIEEACNGIHAPDGRPFGSVIVRDACLKLFDDDNSTEHQGYENAMPP